MARQGLETAYSSTIGGRRLAEALDRRVHVLPRRLGRRGGGHPDRRAGGTPAARACSGWPAWRDARARARRPRRRRGARSRPGHEATADLTEPQFVGMPRRACAPSWRAARGDIDAARAVIDDALDRIEYCSDDVVRDRAALAAMGLRVEGDAGEAARDRRDEEAERVARTRAGALIERLAAGRPRRVPLSRRRSSPPQRASMHAPPAATDPPCGLPRPSAGSELERPYYRRVRALARGRGTDGRPRPRGRIAGCGGGAGQRAPSSAARGLPRSSSRWPHGRGFSSARARRLRPRPLAAERRRPLRPDAPRARGARPRGGRRHEPRDRRAAAHGREDRQRPRLADPGEAERALADRGGGGCAPAGPGNKRLMRALVTGATGFVGGRLAAALAERGADVRCLVRDRERAGDLAAAGHELHEGDVLDADSLRGAGEGVDGRLLPRALHGARHRPGGLRRARAARRRELRAHGQRGGRRARGLPRRTGRRAFRAPAQPRRHGGHARAGGAAARVLPRGHGDRRRQRVVPDGALPGRAAAGDDRARLAAKPHPADRNRRRARVPGPGRRAAGGGRRARSRSAGPTCSPTPSC